MAKHSPWIKHVLATRKSMLMALIQGSFKANTKTEGASGSSAKPTRRPSAPDAVPPKNQER